jgi:alpha-2-macroglobulin
VSMLRDGVVSSREVTVPAGGTTIDLAVDDALAPGAYITAILYRPMDEVAKRMPSRAIGVQWMAVDSDSKTARVTLAVQPKMASGAELLVPVKLENWTAGETAHVVVAAVDVGILNLTSFKTPAPDAWFYGQRQLGVELRDLYGRLIDGMRAEKGSARSGGDGGGLGAMTGTLPTVAPVALFSGILPVNPDGTVTAKLQVPEFNGALRVMAIVWSKDKLGHAEQEIIVRDPVAMLVSGPRFLTLGDQAELTFDLHNVEAPAGDFQLTVQQTDEAGAQLGLVNQVVAMKAGERTLQTAKLKADRMGMTSYAVALTGPGGVNVTRSLALEVKAPAGDVKRTTLQTVKANGGLLTVSSDVLTDLIPERSKVTVAVGPSAPFDVPGLLAQLDRYPYGCAEQTTSRALPLLYLDQVATASGVAPDAGVKVRVQEAVNRLFEMQDSAGSFGLWGPGTADMWLSAYIGDFLTRAKEQGYVVPVLGLGNALDRLQNSVSFASDFERGGEDIAYALYVLARNGRAPVGDLRYYADTRIDRFATPLAKAQIGAALALYGDTVRAERVFDTALADNERLASADDRRDYGSNLRDGAALLTLVSETGVRKDKAVLLSALIAKTRSTRTYTSTQEQAWMLLAARALIEDGKTLRLTVNGTPAVGTLMKSLNARDLATTPFEVRNDGATDTQAVVTVTGEAATPEPAASKGFAIERSYYTLAGERVTLENDALALKQNDRLVVVLQLKPTDNKAGRVLLVDRLAAGLEVENPRLVDSGSIASLPWLTGLAAPEHTEFRDDRFVAALDLGAAASNANQNEGGEGEPATEAAAAVSPAEGGPLLAYIVRAVTPGTFLMPAATIEDMYAPDRYARTGTAKLTVSQ